MQQPQEARYVPALGFRWLTPAYDAVVAATSRERTFKRALIEQASVKRRERVLDLACGTGTLAIWMKTADPEAEVVGLDGDPSILEIASRKAARASVAVTLDHGFSHDLPYPDAHFDCVVSSLFFHHLSWADKQRTVREVFRVLKPGGELHVADWGRASNFVMRGLFLLVQALDSFETTRDNVAGRLVELFEQGGFVQVAQRRAFGTMFGTLALYSAVKPG
jgi:ubiquinone/menaquinone biosynthesis C-methylase UbiE